MNFERPGLMYRPGAWFALVFAAAVTLRLILALTYPHFWGVDGGASGETVNYWTGQVDWWNGFPKPPLAPGWLLAPFWLTLGADIGYKVWSAVFSTLPLIPVFLLTRKYAGPWIGVAATAFAAIDLTWGAMFVTGAHPLVAFALLGMAFWAIGQLVDEFSWRNFAILILSIGLVPWVNQTAAGLAVITLPVFWAALAFAAWRRYRSTGDSAPLVGATLYVVPAAVLGGIIAVGALPWYLSTLPGSSILTFGGPTLYYAFDWPVFQALFISWPLGIFAIWKGPHLGMKALGAVLIVLGCMVQFMSFDEVIINPLYRARYFTALAVYPLLGWVVWHYWIPRVQEWAYPKMRLGQAVVYGGAVAAFLYMGVGFIYTVRVQNEYSLMVTTETAAALQWLRKNDGRANVASNSFTLSLWISALNQVRSPFAFTAPPPAAYVESDKHLRCVLGWVEKCDHRKAAGALNIRYLLIEERFPYYNDRVPGNYMAPQNQWQKTANAEWLELVYSGGTTRLWRISADFESGSGAKAPIR